MDFSMFNELGKPKVWKQYKDTKYWASSEGDVVLMSKRPHRVGTIRENYGRRIHRVSIKNKYIDASRIVWVSFNGEIPEGKCVIHKNGCSTMNDIYNLALVDRKDLGLKYGHKSRSRRVLDTRTNKVYKSLTQCAKNINYSNSGALHLINKGVLRYIDA